MYLPKFSIGEKVFYLWEIVTITSIHQRQHGGDDYTVMYEDGTYSIAEEHQLEKLDDRCKT